MTWKIATWCPSSRTGTVSAPDVAKLCFGPPENPLDVDFEVDTEVLVTLDRDGRDWILRSVVPRFAPQPAGTLSEVFAPLNGRFHGDLCVEAQTHDALSLVAYDCCAWCGPATRVFFEGVSSVVGLDDELDLSCSLFRLASLDEARSLDTPAGQRAYCIVSHHGNGPDGPRVFVVARSVRVELGASVRVED